MMKQYTKEPTKVQGALLLDVVIRERTAILELLASEDQALLVRRDAAHHRRDKHASYTNTHTIRQLTLPCLGSWP
jgi:hypothetical protein